jgi:hypothetical protein
MTTKALTFVFCLLTPGMLLAQTAKPPAASRPPVQGQQMYEDIEIMRRILNRKLGTWPSLIALNQRCTTCHVTSAAVFRNFGSDGKVDLFAANNHVSNGAAFGDSGSEGKVDFFVVNDPHAAWLNQSLFNNPHNPDPHASLPQSLQTEGLYLKGHGVVYTLTLPPPPRVPRPQGKKAPAKPLSEWDRTRRQIRGDTEESQNLGVLETKQIEAWISNFQDERPHLWLTESILKILAENGHHFSQLPENESLTVAVTFRDSGQLKGQTNHNANRGTLDAWGAQDQPLQTWQNQQPIQGQDQWQNQQPGPTPGERGGGGGAEPWVFGDKAPTGNKSPSSLRDFELLGDMHLRQGKAREAIKTYQDALSLIMEPKQAAAIYRKIAQADLALEDDAGAKQALEMAQQFLKHQAQAAEGNVPKQQTGGSAPKPQAAPLVSKLIISAPKRLLDQVAAGKMAFHDFEKQVAAEYIGFSASEKKDDKPNSTNSK